MMKTLAYCDMCGAFIDLSHDGKIIPSIVHIHKTMVLCDACAERVRMFIEDYPK